VRFDDSIVFYPGVGRLSSLPLTRVLADSRPLNPRPRTVTGLLKHCRFCAEPTGARINQDDVTQGIITRFDATVSSDKNTVLNFF